jgi:RNA polymerase sigma factor (sigma-70 family)
MKNQNLKSSLEIALSTRRTTDEQAFFTILYKEFFEPIYAIAKKRYPEHAEDIVQDYFCYKLLRIPLDRYAEILEYINAYLFKGAINYCETYRSREVLRSTKYNNKQAGRSSLQYIKTSADVEYLLDIERALSQINPRQRSVIWLHYYEGYKYGEIANKLESKVTAGAMKQLARRGVFKLRKELRSYTYSN